jgi:hypothetical protein
MKCAKANMTHNHRTRVNVWLDTELVKAIDEKAVWTRRDRTSWMEIELARLIGIFRLLPEYGADPKPHRPQEHEEQK